jgi:hypothetical protein
MIEEKAGLKRRPGTKARFMFTWLDVVQEVNSFPSRENLIPFVFGTRIIVDLLGARYSRVNAQVCRVALDTAISCRP